MIVGKSFLEDAAIAQLKQVAHLPGMRLAGKHHSNHQCCVSKSGTKEQHDSSQ